MEGVTTLQCKSSLFTRGSHVTGALVARGQIQMKRRQECSEGQPRYSVVEGSVEMAANWALDRRFLPAMDPALRTRLYQGWQRAVARVRQFAVPE